MVRVCAFALFELLLCCSASRINLISHSYHNEKQLQEAKDNNAQLNTVVSRPVKDNAQLKAALWKILLHFLSASVGNSLVVEGLQPLNAPARVRRQLHSTHLDVPLTMELKEFSDESTDRVEKPLMRGVALPLSRRGVLAGVLLGGLGRLAESLGVPSPLGEATERSLWSRSGPNDTRSKELQTLMSIMDPDGAGIIVNEEVGTEEMARVMRTLGIDPTDKGVQRLIEMIEDGEVITDGEFLGIIKLVLQKTLDSRLDQMFEAELLLVSRVDPVGGTYDSDVLRVVRYTRDWAKQQQSAESLQEKIAQLDDFMTSGERLRRKGPSEKPLQGRREGWSLLEQQLGSGLH